MKSAEAMLPDVGLACICALLWHRRLWSPFLNCYAILGGRVPTEAFRRGLIKEVMAAMRAVERRPRVYRNGEFQRLWNLVACVCCYSPDGATKEEVVTQPMSGWQHERSFEPNH